MTKFIARIRSRILGRIVLKVNKFSFLSHLLPWVEKREVRHFYPKRKSGFFTSHIVTLNWYIFLEKGSKKEEEKKGFFRNNIGEIQ